MSIEALSPLDDEEWSVRSLQGNGPTLPFVPLTAPVDRMATSVAPARSSETPLHRPELPAPSHNVMIDLLDMHQETERLTNKGAKLFEAETAQNMAEIDRLNAEKMEALQQEAKAAKSRATWSTLATVSQYLTGASALVLGWATLGVSTVAGALLIASGGLGLANRVLHDTPLLETITAWFTESQERQQKIARQIEMGCFYLQLGLGLAGGLWAWQTGAFAFGDRAEAEEIVTKVSSIIGTASGVMTTGSMVGMKLYEKKIKDMEAKLKEINGQVTTHSQTLSQESGQASRMIEATQFEIDELRRAIQNLEISQE